MKRFLFPLMAALMLSFGLASCEKDEIKKSQLEGVWLVKSLELPGLPAIEWPAACAQVTSTQVTICAGTDMMESVEYTLKGDKVETSVEDSPVITIKETDGKNMTLTFSFKKGEAKYVAKLVNAERLLPGKWTLESLNGEEKHDYIFVVRKDKTAQMSGYRLFDYSYGFSLKGGHVYIHTSGDPDYNPDMCITRLSATKMTFTVDADEYVWSK